ncbi:MAG: glutathione-disulfide reductase [Bdellovibrionales bacterium]|nr:glutathione-disulfide reductase [Bdellovibrionales bacterium]MBT3525893.1 glutathione-disulfide reductase [Bdellovibrionales bacterium]MBT7765909.1 glutathione-disulfide reductase [Bdellovibrionales bacterium]
MTKTYDLVVIGGGSGGVRVARWSASLGAKVALCENDRMGGTCVIRGCVPKKMMVMAAQFQSEMNCAQDYGWQLGASTFNWPQLKNVRDQEIARLSGLYRKMLDSNQVDCYLGAGKLLGNHQVEVDGQTLSAKHIVIATGGKPQLPKISGIEHVLTSNDLFELKEQPRKVVIVGGGYIAVEFAGILNGLGSEVTLVIRRSHILRGFEQKAREFLQDQIVASGVTLKTCGVDKITLSADDKKNVHLGDGQTIEVDAVIYATGRVPNTSELNLEAENIEVNQVGAIQADHLHQTAASDIYAIGDCTDRVNLTPVATTEGTILAERLFNDGTKEMNYQFIPSAVFSWPPLASVGPTEEEARQQYGELDIYQSDFRPLKYTITQMTERTLVRLLVERKTQRVVACHMVGIDAPEIMQGVAIAIKAGATKEQFDNTIGIHPTSAEELVTLRNKLDQ